MYYFPKEVLTYLESSSVINSTKLEKPQTQEYVPRLPHTLTHRQRQELYGAFPPGTPAPIEMPGPREPESVYGRLIGQNGKQVGTLVERGALYLNCKPSDISYRMSYDVLKCTSYRRKQNKIANKFDPQNCCNNFSRTNLIDLFS